MSRILGRLLAPVAALLLVTCHNEGPTPVGVGDGGAVDGERSDRLTVQLTATTRDANQHVLAGAW